MESVKQRIDEKEPDYVRIRYYPSCKITNSIITINNIDHEKLLNQKIKDVMTTMKKLNDSFTEYGIKDTFLRKHENGTHSYFRREQYLFKYESMTDGVFVIELYNKCDEDEFPHIINYSHNISYVTTSYVSNRQCIVYSKIINNKSTTVKPQNSIPRIPCASTPGTSIKKDQYKQYENNETNTFDINTEINIKNFDKSVNDFVDYIAKIYN